MNVANILGFLTELSQNNNREWFAAHKERYDACKADFDQLGKSLILEISTFDDELRNVEVKDCVF